MTRIFAFSLESSIEYKPLTPHHAEIYNCTIVHVDSIV